MTKYAKGRHAVAECQRSGQKMRYRDLVEDGHVPGLLVHPDWWEPKHPQETPPDMTDPIALRRPAPEISIETDYGNPEAPTPLPTDPLPSEPNTTLAVAMTAGDTQVVLNEALKYNIGEYVFIALDGGGWFVSLIRSTADSPHLTVPFTTPFTGAAAQGNQVYIGTGFALVTTTFTVTLAQFGGNVGRVGYTNIGSPAGSVSPNPALLLDQDGKLTGFDEVVSYESGNPWDFGYELWFGGFQAGADPTASLGFETYSTIEIDYSGGTLVLDTRDVGNGGDMDQAGSTVGTSFWFPNIVTKTWDTPDIGQQYQVRFIP